MISQVIFKIDTKLKVRAMKKAQSEGLPFATVLKLVTQAFADGQIRVGLMDAATFNARTQLEVQRAVKDVVAGKNMSPRYTTASAAMKYLRS